MQRRLALSCSRAIVQADKFLRSDGYRNYDLDTLREGKAACKAALQRVRFPARAAAYEESQIRVFCLLLMRLELSEYDLVCFLMLAQAVTADDLRWEGEMLGFQAPADAFESNLDPKPFDSGSSWLDT